MTQETSDQAIGIFDSGCGGLTVLRELIAQLPNETFYYLGDTARVPYGNKSASTIIRYAYENTDFLIEKGIKALVVACNTATVYALDSLQSRYRLPIVGVVSPGAEQAVAVTRTKQIAVLGTRATIQSGIYTREIQRLMPDAVVHEVSCPLFVPLVEEHLFEDAITEQVIHRYLQTLRSKQIDSVLLGCTHYPLLHGPIQRYLGDAVVIVDSAYSCSHTLQKLLNDRKLGRKGPAGFDHQFFVSDAPDHFKVLGEQFLGKQLPEVLSMN